MLLRENCNVERKGYYTFYSTIVTYAAKIIKYIYHTSTRNIYKTDAKVRDDIITSIIYMTSSCEILTNMKYPTLNESNQKSKNIDKYARFIEIDNLAYCIPMRLDTDISDTKIRENILIDLAKNVIGGDYLEDFCAVFILGHCFNAGNIMTYKYIMDKCNIISDILARPDSRRELWPSY